MVKVSIDKQWKEKEKNYKPLVLSSSKLEKLNSIDLLGCYIHAMNWLIQKTLLVD